MKVILFRNGDMGEIVSLPGEHPMVELCDLLGGEAEFIQLDKRMQLVALAYGEKMELPMRYSAQSRQVSHLGYMKFPVYGDCAVICRRVDGVIVDAKQDDCLVANLMVEAVKK